MIIVDEGSRMDPDVRKTSIIEDPSLTAEQAMADSSAQHGYWPWKRDDLIQERPASQREELVESLTTSEQTPWTYTRLAEEIGGTQYEDISAEVPSATEWHRAQDIQAEVQPPRSRIRGKRAAPEQPEDLDLEDPESSEPSQPSTFRRRDRLPGPQPGASAGAQWQDSIRENAWAAEETCFWADEAAAVAIEVEMPQSNRGWDKFLSNPQSYFVGALRRRAVEVSEKRLSPEDREKFREAKNKEVRNFIAAQAFEALPEHLKPSRSQAIGMRWLLTWKPQDNGSVKAKARAILLGYQDPNYEFRSTTAPVTTRQTRQLFLQAAANRRWRIQKGDITGAFLQGREYPSELFCIPCDEILESMNLPAGSIVRLKRACYGLVDPPLEWYRTVAEFLESIGLTRLWSDACAWVWRPQGVLRGMITGHVDDFLFGGSEEDEGWQEILRLIKDRFKWGDWDQDSFVQCGVLIETTSEGFNLSQPHYLANLEEIHINAQRRKDTSSETTDWEKTQLRALLGGLSWFSQQTGPHLAAEISMMLSEVVHSTVETINRANLLLQHAKTRKDHKLCIFRHRDEDMQFFAWVDAANKNRPGDGSTQGIFIGAASKQLLQGEVCSISPMSWNSTKISRSCRSPGSAETQAAVNGEDSLFYMRYQWSEMQNGRVDLRNPSAVVRQTGGCLITDSRNVYDKLSTEVLTVQGEEKKANLELLSVKESQMATNLVVRWVHSEAQLANALTKKGAKEFELYYKMRFMWRIVEDPAMRSARKRRWSAKLWIRGLTAVALGRPTLKHLQVLALQPSSPPAFQPSSLPAFQPCSPPAFQPSSLAAFRPASPSSLPTSSQPSSCPSTPGLGHCSSRPRTGMEGWRAGRLRVGRLQSWKVGGLEGWKAGGLEGWKAGRLEGWKAGKLEGWKAGRLERLESWKAGRLEGWRAGRLEGWKAGRLEGWKAGRLEGLE
ncbi:Copia protein [Symbiodinium microadriaticum]|uniref:Copia protein n=1 Tax=Symbiodinium microadriaticum TaxID=2951 RepID=A0A1Q9DN19_SYMMI|nr:Copia protein [Symbiodinium microadriaticum]